MRNRPRNLQARRRRWPLRLGLFLIYVLVQYVASARTTSSEAPMTLTSSSAQYEGSSVSEPTESSIIPTEETIEESSTVPPIVEEPRRKIHTEGSKNEKARGHGDAKASEKANIRDLAKEGKEPPKKETEAPLLKHVRSTTVSIANQGLISKKIRFILYYYK